MPKIETAGGFRKISIGQIVDTGNVRKVYSDIEELAESIRITGQLEPILVKGRGKNSDGIDEYELVAGHRRYRAFQKLCDAGESFTMIDAILIAGDKLTIQLIENLQRTDLTAPERESGIYQMCQNGLSQREVAARLAKTEYYISRHVSAYKIREAAESSGINTHDLATGALNEIQGADAVDIPNLVKRIIDNGGTSHCARDIMREYRARHEKTETKNNPDMPSLPDKSEIDSISNDTQEEREIQEEADDDPPYEPPPSPPEKPEPKSETRKPDKSYWRDPLDDDFDPPHKTVDFNDVCLSIAGYVKKREKEIAACPNSKTGSGDCSECPCEIYHKREAARDIIALLHDEL